ncbi:MAG: trypsin-like peptidase domain-containing protein [Planctomycetota bacterium]|nr:trypsin-like peptidase domain-containing protein [Planctomycetota bacterium]
MRKPLIPAGTTSLLTVLVSALVVGTVGFHLGSADAAREGSRRRTTPIVTAVQHAAPAVVSVYADLRSRRGYLRRGAGSGVIVHPSGYIVTNSHVIKGGQRFWVELFNGNGRYPAQVLANEPSRDLALLKINVPTARLRHVSIAPTNRVMLGETAIAVGNPRGLGDTITVGVVSALGRDAKMSSGTVLRNLIQTDASINTGNSGGALLNLDGELIGVIVSLLPSASGIAFAIPGDQVDQLLRRALRTSAPKNSLPDAAPQPTPKAPTPRAPSATSSHRETPTSTPGLPTPVVKKPTTSPLHPTDFGLDIYDSGNSLRVRHVSRGGSASKAGFLPGDSLLTVDGTPVEDRTDLLMAFSRSRPGQDYYVGIRRGSIRKYLVLTVPK